MEKSNILKTIKIEILISSIKSELQDERLDYNSTVNELHHFVHLRILPVYHSDDVIVYYAQVVYSVYTPGYTSPDSISR